MQFLNFLKVDPKAFMRSMENTSDVELLCKIQDISNELQYYWTDGIPKYGVNLELEKECIEAKKEILCALLNEYQIRRCLTGKC